MLIVLFTIFVTQNTNDFQLNVFFWQFTFPGILAFVITGAAGVLIGLILGSIFHSSKKKKSKQDDIYPKEYDQKGDLQK
jgi:uncharacterized integral membrane protein